MKKLLVTAFAAALSLGALAFEKHMIRVPDELNPKEGIKGVTTYFFAPAAVSIPLKDGNWIYLVNETPKQEDEGGPAQIGVPKKIVELDVVSRYLEAMKRFPSITVQIGESTFFAYRCRDMFPAQDGLFLNNCYQGVVASMGSEYSISLFLPDGRGLDDEVRGIWGFHDMAGNVAEWCSDWHKDYYITHPKELTDPKGETRQCGTGRFVAVVSIHIGGLSIAGVSSGICARQT